MTNVLLVERKLAVLTEHLQRLRTRRPATRDGFLADTLVQDALAMGVLVVAQEAVDIALHVASDEGWGVPTRVAEGFELLARHGVIPHDLAAELGRAVQLRHRIAHGYATLDAGRLWDELPAGIATFGEYARCVARYVLSMS